MSLEITSVDSSHTAPQTQGVRRMASPSGRLDAQGDPLRTADQVEISDEARKASEAPVRQALVDSIKALIASGQYETPDKLDGAIEGLARDLSA